MLYVSRSDRVRLWKINPHDMAEKNINYSVTFKAKKLTFGGFGKAKIINIEEISGQPIIYK